MDIIIGTAGHIDHGKTALVKALTGVDADRFPEEKQRGITIDIGFAELDLGAVRIGFVDVPGHEKFVKNMLAGASGIDLVALVVAADAGVMPQTREHFEICRLLETKNGLIVLTKKDLVDAEFLELVESDVAELVKNSFLENSPVIAVSAKTGEGIERLRETLKILALKIPARKNETLARLPIDRSFSIRGFGTVVTGTLIAGEISEADELEILPDAKKVRVRGLQTHGRSIETVRAGQRAAVNLGGIEHAAITRGMVLCEKNVLRPTQIFDAEIEVLKTAKKSLKSRQRVRVHIGTIEALARVQVLNETGEIEAGATDFVQMRLEIPIATIPSERFIVRSYSPQATMAGGTVLDNAAIRHRRKETENVRRHLRGLIEAGGDKVKLVQLYLAMTGADAATFADLQARTGWRREILQTAIRANVENRAMIEADGFLLTRAAFENLKSKTLSEIGDFHRREPLAKGIPRETLREKIYGHLPPEIFRSVMSNLEKEKRAASEKDTIRLAAHNLELSADEKLLRGRLEQIYLGAKLEVPKLEDALHEALKSTKATRDTARKVFQLLLDAGEVVKITDEFYFSANVVDNLVRQLKNYAATSADKLIDVAKFKDIAGVSRKYAIPLLEFFDRQRITRRAGDKRLIL